MVTVAMRRIGMMSVTGLVGVCGCDAMTPSGDESRIAVASERKGEVRESEVPARLQEVPAAPARPGVGGTSGAEPGRPVEGAGKDSSANASTAASPSDAASLATIGVKRMVVANEIREREPVPLTEFAVGAPVVAFLELANPSPVDSKVQVLFHHENGKSVGLVELPVPGGKTRWRTWARSELVKDSGAWTAVVSQVGGPELDRRSFVLP